MKTNKIYYKDKKDTDNKLSLEVLYTIPNELQYVRVNKNKFINTFLGSDQVITVRSGIGKIRIVYPEASGTSVEDTKNISEGITLINPKGVGYTIIGRVELDIIYKPPVYPSDYKETENIGHLDAILPQTFSSIPKPIKWELMLRVNYSDLTSLCQTNKEVNEICKDDAFWVQKIENDYGKDTKVPDQIKRLPAKDWYLYANLPYTVKTVRDFKKEVWGNERGTGYVVVRRYWPNGNVMEEYTLLNGKKNGLYQSWWSNQQKRSILNYKKDIPQGLEERWWPNGNKMSEEHFNEKGQYDGEHVLYWSNGNIQTIGSYTKDEFNGLRTNFYRNGSKKSDIEFKDDEYNGLNRMWDQEGNLIKDCIYSKGIKVSCTVDSDEIADPDEEAIEDFNFDEDSEFYINFEAND